jgi:hypothetical protein
VVGPEDAGWQRNGSRGAPPFKLGAYQAASRCVATGKPGGVPAGRVGALRACGLNCNDTSRVVGHPPLAAVTSSAQRGVGRERT